MSDKKILRVLAAIFALRAKYFDSRGDHWSASAYESAYYMLSYAAMGWVDELRQFGWSDEAEALIDEAGEDVDFYKIMELIRQRSLE